jgi:hypothetical protein
MKASHRDNRQAANQARTSKADKQEQRQATQRALKGVDGMKSTHNTLRALAVGIALTLLVITGTAAMMAAFSGPSRATDMYRSAVVAPIADPVKHMVTGHDSVLYHRVVLADGRAQWVLTEERQTSLAAPTRGSEAQVLLAETDEVSAAPAGIRPASYTLGVKPSGLSKPVKDCGRSAYSAYDIACNTLS